MLQSIHRGLCLVMQSMHDSTQHRPIISMEEFPSQVAWPGVQPSPLEVGEASVAQEPQLQPEVPHEATPEATPQTSPITSPVLEVSGEEDGIANADYAADMIAAQSTWDSWPVTNLETPQDAPSSPHGEPAPTQDKQTPAQEKS